MSRSSNGSPLGLREMTSRSRRVDAQLSRFTDLERQAHRAAHGYSTLFVPSDVTPPTEAPDESEMASKSVERARIRQCMPPELRDLSAMGQRRALAYAPDKCDVEAADDAAALARSRDAVARIVAASNVDDAYVRSGVMHAMTRLGHTLPDMAGDLASDALQRKLDIDEHALDAAPAHTTVGAVLHDAGGPEFVAHITSVLGHQLALARDRAVKTTELLAEASARQLSSTGAAVRASREERTNEFRRPTKAAATSTTIIVLDTSSEQSARAPTGFIALPAELFHVDEDADADSAGEAAQHSTVQVADIVSHLRYVARNRANRLADAFKNREASVRRLLHTIAELRTRVQAFELMHDDATVRVRHAFAAHGALQCATEDTADLAAIVEEGVDSLWGELRREFQTEIQSAVRAAYRHAADAQRVVEAPTGTSEDDVRALQDALKKALAGEATAVSHMGVLEEEMGRCRAAETQAEGQVRATKQKLLAAARTEVGLRECISRLEGVIKEQEVRIVELSSTKREDSVKLHYENLLTLKNKEIESVRKEISASKAQAIDAMVQLNALRKDLSTAQLAGLQAGEKTMSHFSALISQSADCAHALIGGLRDRHAGRLREATLGVFDDLARHVLAACAAVGSDLKPGDAQITMGTLGALRSLQISAQREAPLLLAEPLSVTIDTLTTRCKSLEDSLAALLTTAKKAIIDVTAKEHSSASSLCLQATTALRALLDSQSLKEVENAAFPNPRPPGGIGDVRLESGSEPAWVWKVNNDSLGYLKGVWHSMKRELLRLRSQSVDVEVTSGTAVPAFAATLNDDGRQAREVCQRLLRDVADVVGSSIGEPLFAALTHIAERDGEFRSRHQAQQDARDGRRLVTRKLAAYMLRRATLAAWTAQRVEALDRAKRSIAGFVMARRAELNDGACGLVQSPDVDSAVDRLTRYHAAAERRHAAALERVRQRRLQRDLQLWHEFEALNRERGRAPQ
jgi:hypothetical protein